MGPQFFALHPPEGLERAHVQALVLAFYVFSAPLSGFSALR